MVRVASRNLTGLGFRRDVKVFLALLVGFLVVLILALVVTLQSFLLTVEDYVAESSRVIGLAAERDLQDLQAGPLPVLENAKLEEVRKRYELQAIQINLPDGRFLRAGSMPPQEATFEGAIPAGRLSIWFENDEIRALERTFRRTAVICLVATVLGTLLLLAFLPRVVRPVESLLDQAREVVPQEGHVDEERYLLETFRDTIQKLREHETELSRLHQLEKARADELDLVASTLTRNLASGFMALDPGGVLVEINGAGREILGPSSEAVQTGSMILEAMPHGELRETLATALADRRAVTRAEVGHDDKVIGLTVVPLSAENGNHMGLLTLFTDLTHVKRLEDRLRELQNVADLGDLAAGVAHEFRNSLAAILGYLRLARQNAEGETDARIGKATAEANQLALAVERFLESARTLTLTLQPVDLENLLAEVIVRLGSAVPTVQEGTAAAVLGDGALLQRVFENLIRNAQQSVEQKGSGSVQIRISADEAASVVEIRDSGVGFSGEDTGRFFLPFNSRRPGGIGLGLFIARKIVLLHGGRIDLTSEEGTGASVRVELPREPGND